MEDQEVIVEAMPPAPVPAGGALGQGVVIREETGQAGQSVDVASQWTLMWWKFRRHKLAMIGLVLAAILYLIAIFGEFLSTSDPNKVNAAYTYAPPQTINFVREENGQRVWGLHVLGYKSEINPETMARSFVEDPEQVIPISFWVRGHEYEIFGFIPFDRHLFGPSEAGQPFFVLGADRLGQDLYSRMIMGTRISMSIGLVSVFVSLILGVIIGGISGYFSGGVDTFIQRVIEFIQGIPTIPLWLGFAAAVPATWSPLRTYFAITVILSIIGWTGLARVVRGRFLSLREEEFVTAARLDGAGEMRIILRHMLPSFSSHIIASVTLAIPGIILAETALSFLGLGLRSPINSWGVLLQEAQNIRSVSTAPWLLLPGIMVIIAVISLNFLGDGLRDAADPYDA